MLAAASLKLSSSFIAALGNIALHHDLSLTRMCDHHLTEILGSRHLGETAWLLNVTRTPGTYLFYHTLSVSAGWLSEASRVDGGQKPQGKCSANGTDDDRFLGVAANAVECQAKCTLRHVQAASPPLQPPLCCVCNSLYADSIWLCPAWMLLLL